MGMATLGLLAGTVALTGLWAEVMAGLWDMETMVG